ncbi:ProQ/FinO family protein [Serratia sp. UGAL515B_01]|uniref:ProQ/FinO family protein n=1 Tax=Serratia sp. UGAL515B_01 TaxID=2986763 RepID=UPI002954AC97|nr:ProQ/FinO family protein [Serratia sp. UGAL515B_01]WON77020.1 ProQ/FinO family protein [Serratia sp. UGAL515B_01]
MNTMQEQLQQVKQQMSQQGKKAGAAAPAGNHKKSVAPQKTTSATEKDAAANPWNVTAKHTEAPQQPGEVGKNTKEAGKVSQNKKKIGKLAEHWPKGFTLAGVRPLSIGIQGALINDAKARDLPITENQIRYCLSAYTKRPAYMKALAAGGPRYDLNGQPCGEVSTEHKEEARQRSNNQQKTRNLEKGE